MEFEEREIKTLEADFETYEEWVEEHQLEIMEEMLEACEEIVLDELDEQNVINVKVVTPLGYMLQVFKIYRQDIRSGLKKVMQKCIEKEAYELCQRVVDIQDYIEEENVEDI